MDFPQARGEPSAVFGVLDGGNRRAEYPHPKTCQHAATVQLQAAVERCLSAEAEQDALRPFPLNHLGNERRLNGKEVNAVSQMLGCLDGGNVRVDEDNPQAFRRERLDRLGAGVIKFAGLADFQRARAEQKDFFQWRWHGLAQAGDEFVENEAGVGWAGVGFRVELHRDHRVPAVTNAFDCAVVGVGKPRPPAVRQLGPHGVAVVLAGEVAARRAGKQARLVLAAVAELHFVRVAAGRQRHQLDAEANAERRYARGDEALQLRDGGAAAFGVARAVGNHHPMVAVGKAAEVVVCGDADDREVTLQQAPDDAELHSAVDQHHASLASTVHRWAADRDVLYEVVGIRMWRRVRSAAERNHGRHGTGPPELLRQRAGINAGDRRHAFRFQPLAERPHGGEMAVAL